MGHHFRAFIAFKASCEDELYKNNFFDRFFASEIDNERVAHLYSEIKALCHDLHAGGRVEITFDTRHIWGKMEHNNRDYKGRIAVFTGRVSWIAFDNSHAAPVRLSMYAASSESPIRFCNMWRKVPSIETKKCILEDLLRQVEIASLAQFGQGFKTLLMQKYSDKAFCQSSPRSPPKFDAWDGDESESESEKSPLLMSQRGRPVQNVPAVNGTRAPSRAQSWTAGARPANQFTKWGGRVHDFA